MPLNFHKDAICLSGSLGSKLKSDIIHQYYNRWWLITSGGYSKNYRYPTAIIEMNAGTGEIYIEDTEETILGSAGSALKLKFKNPNKSNPNITLILVEEDEECISHLKNVINRRFPSANLIEKIDDSKDITQNCVLLYNDVREAIQIINQLDVKGSCIFFFDPLLSIDMNPLREVYNTYIEIPFKRGKEYMIFFFTSDWIFGREPLSPLPYTPDESQWSDEARKSVVLLNNVYGDNLWYKEVLSNERSEIRMNKLINEYQKRLFKMFRFVVPLPFVPKLDQLYHLIFCSNYVAGASIITNLYSNSTNNKWTPNNRAIYKRFKNLHKGDLYFPSGSARPAEWKILWNFIKYYINGKFDILCPELEEKADGIKDIQSAFKWLLQNKYIKKYDQIGSIIRFELNWKIISKNLNLDPPSDFQPLTRLKPLKYN